MKIIEGIVCFTFTLSCISCKINQTKHGEPVGRWVYTSEIDGKTEKTTGRYTRKGLQKGIWKYTYDGRLYKKEAFVGNTAFVTEYHPNGNIAAEGQTKLEASKDTLHWFYFGDWFWYDQKGKLKAVKNYYKGILTRITKIHDD